MNNIAAIRRAKGIRQRDLHRDVGLFSKVETGKALLPPGETLKLASTLGTTVDKLYPDKSEVVIPYPPSQKSTRQCQREQEQGIDKLTIRIPHELAERFKAICKGHTQAGVFEVMVAKMEKDRRPHHRASGQQKNITASL